MADFNLAWAALERDEGGYANNPADPGGETYEGISRRYWPTWPGWQWVDKYKSGAKPDIQGMRQDMDLEEAVKSFYKSNFWHFDAVTDQYIANKLLSEEVNMGAGQGIKCLQRALGSVMSGPFVVDGSWGPKTQEALTEALEWHSDRLKAEFRAQVAYRYAVKSGAQSPFLLGWMRRATE